MFPASCPSTFLPVFLSQAGKPATILVGFHETTFQLATPIDIPEAETVPVVAPACREVTTNFVLVALAALMASS
jgi:hypothetical protein